MILTRGSTNSNINAFSAITLIDKDDNRHLLASTPTVRGKDGFMFQIEARVAEVRYVELEIDITATTAGS